MVLFGPFLGLTCDLLHFLPILPSFSMEYTPLFHNHETGKLVYLVWLKYSQVVNDIHVVVDLFDIAAVLIGFALNLACLTHFPKSVFLQLILHFESWLVILAKKFLFNKEFPTDGAKSRSDFFLLDSLCPLR